jgi:hypothetical protein
MALIYFEGLFKIIALKVVDISSKNFRFVRSFICR